MPDYEVTAADVLAHLDEVIRLSREWENDRPPFSADYCNGYMRALTDFRKYVRSEAFSRIVTKLKETPTHAHRR